MVNDYFPHNRLEWVKYLMLCRRVFIHCVWIGAVVVTMIHPEFALAANYDPSNVPGLVTGGNINTSALPTGFFTSGNCASTNCSGVSVFGAVPTATSTASAETCVATIFNTDTNMHLNDWVSNGAGANTLQVDRFSSGNLRNLYCWESGAWVFYSTGVNGGVPFIYPSSTQVLTTINWQYTGGGTVSSVYSVLGFGSSIANNAIFVAANSSLNSISASLTPNTYGTQPGSFVSYSLRWQGLTFDPSYLDFYEATGGLATNIVNDFPLGGTGTYSFSHLFSNVGNYQPIAVLGTCAAGSSDPTCKHYTVSQTGAEIVAAYSPATTLASTLSASPTSVSSGSTLVQFHIILNSAFCAPGSQQGARLFLGLPASASYLDPGLVINFGGWAPATYNSYHALTYGTGATTAGSFTPYVHVYCSDGTYANVYLGNDVVLNSALVPADAQSISVNLGANILPSTTTYQNGGTSSNFGPGTGALLETDKQAYATYEPIYIRWVQNASFTVGSIVLYKDKAKLTATGDTLSFTSATDLSKNILHGAEYSYTTNGTFQPVLEVRSNAYSSGNPATYQDIYLGGLGVPNPLYALQLSMYTAGTSVTYTTGTGTIFNVAGSFLQLPIPANASPLLVALINIFNTMAGVIMAIANLAYGYIQSAPVFNVFSSLVAPPPGTQVTLPTNFMGQDVSRYVNGLTMTRSVTYANANTSYLVLLQIIVMFGFATYVMRKIFHHQ